MVIQEENHGAVSVVRPIGPIAKDDAERLRHRLAELRKESLGRLVVDTTSVPFVDSRGLEVLLQVSEDLAESGRVLKLCCLNEVLREVLELTELASMFEHFEDVNAAVRSFL
ncbi:MAG: STAS domain-containing protein [Planctomycetota bacterium]|jgi:anti-sigma B factor antagonist